MDYVIIDDCLGQLASKLHALAAALPMREHKFVFNGETVVKPGIYEAETASPLLDEAEARILALLTQHWGPIRGGASIKVQKNVGGAFPAHFDNAGPPSKRFLTAILYLTSERAGGELRLTPFLERPVVVTPQLGRLVAFRSDRILHSVDKWTSTVPRLAVSFWFDGPVDDKTLTKDDLRFPNWDAAVDFFKASPRFVSRAVYDDEYLASLDQCGFDDQLLDRMRASHHATVARIYRQLRPIVDECRRRKHALCASVPVAG